MRCWPGRKIIYILQFFYFLLLDVFTDDQFILQQQKTTTNSIPKRRNVELVIQLRKYVLLFYLPGVSLIGFFFMWSFIIWQSFYRLLIQNMVILIQTVAILTIAKSITVQRNIYGMIRWNKYVFPLYCFTWILIKFFIQCNCLLFNFIYFHIKEYWYWKIYLNKTKTLTARRNVK